MDAHASNTSTLVESERALRPVTLAFASLCPALGVLALAYALALNPDHTASPLWISSACALALLVFSNLQFALSHPHALTIGIIPIAIESASLAAVPLALQGEGAPAALVAARIALGLGVALTLVFGAWFLRLSRASMRQDALAPDCVLIVLGAAVCEGQPSETLKRRLDLAASLLAGHPERMAILSGGAVRAAGTARTTDARGGARGDDLTEADVMREYLLGCGVPSEQMAPERKAANTRQNIEYSLALTKELGLSGNMSEGTPEGASEGTSERKAKGAFGGTAACASECVGATPTSARTPRQLCVVSNDYHLYRAIRCGQKLGADLVGCGARTPLRSWPQQWCREVLTILAGR